MELAGEILAQNIYEFKFGISGKLSQINVKESSTVKKGQLLAKLDQTELQAYLDRALKYYEQVRAEFDEKQKTNLSETDKRKIQAELDVSVKNIEIAKTNLEATNLYSPCDGIVIDCDPVISGMNITPNSLVITVVDVSSFYFEAVLPEENITKVKPDMPAKVELKAFPDKIIEGKVSWIGYMPLDDGMYGVKITLNDQSELKIGMTGKAQI
jgi:membrane fusion protein (multidrug efflux system)